MSQRHSMRARLNSALLFATAFTATSVLILGTDEAYGQTQQAGAADTRPFPRQFEQGGLRFWLHTPQFETLSGNRITGRAAVSVQTGERRNAGGKAEPILTYGVVWFAARAEIDKIGRSVALSDMQALRVSFPTQAANEARFLQAIQASAAGAARIVSLDQLEASIALGQVRGQESSLAVRNVAPEIMVAFEPAVMIHLDGDAVLRPMAGTTAKRVINTRALILWSGEAYYLRLGGRWARAGRLEGPWTLVTAVPANVSAGLAEATARKLADPMDRPGEEIVAVLASGRLPLVSVRTRPAELVPVSGQPQLAPIGTLPLAYVANSPADLFVHNRSDWYVLISGRWFAAPAPAGPWSYVDPAKLPAAFAQIPANSAKGAVLASIPGTPQAREAVIANSIPQTASVNRATAKFSAVYDGTPEFAPIAGTALSYARNAAAPVIRVNATRYYAVSSGVWFTAASPMGPWAVATRVDPAIYTIPVSSPLHYVTYVQVYGTSGDTVHVGYTPGYYGTVVTNNVVVYGAGYACTSWTGSAWYGCPATYGTGATFGYSAVAGWTVGFGWGVYAATSPWWGPYWPGYYPGVAYPVAGAWNVYGQWGNAVVSGTGAAWANPWTGNYGHAARGAYSNQATGGVGVGRAAVNTNAYTGTTVAGAQGVRYNPETGRVVGGEVVAAGNPYTGQAGVAGHREVYNTNTGRQTSSVGAAGAGPNGAAAGGAFSSTGSGGTVSGAGGVYYDRSSGTVERGGAVKVNDNVYAAHDGSVYKQTDSGWETMERGSQRSGSTGGQSYGPPSQSLDRESIARSRGANGNGGFTGNGRFGQGSAGSGGFQRPGGGQRPSFGGGGGARRPRG